MILRSRQLRESSEASPNYTALLSANTMTKRRSGSLASCSTELFRERSPRSQRGQRGSGRR